MQLKKMNETIVGIASASGAYLLWGILPVYWKLIYSVPAQEILAHRIIWSFFLMLGILIVTKRLRPFLAELRYIITQPKKFFYVIMAALLISVNWVIYIWAVNDNRIIETSLGYYINPLVSGLLGIIVLKEKLSFWQTIAFLLASIGVLHMTLNFGAIPWISLLLAFSFGLYGKYRSHNRYYARDPYCSAHRFPVFSLSPAAREWGLYCKFIHCRTFNGGWYCNGYSIASIYKCYKSSSPNSTQLSAIHIPDYFVGFWSIPI
jgi:RarD protein